MIRVVVDTNVLVSALISPRGNEALLVLAINDGLVRTCYSSEILDEYAEVLARPKFGFPADIIAELIDTLRRNGDLIRVKLSIPLSPDPGDDKFLACALAAKADFVATGNKRDFPEPRIEPTKVVSTAELLDLITIEM